MGIRERVGRDFTIEDARKQAVQLLRYSAIGQEAKEDEIETEIIEESIFNMVDGFYTTGKNIRVKAQIKPGLIGDLRV